MSLISYIALVALATAFTAMYELFIPIMKTLEVTEPDDILIKNKTLSYITMFLLSILFFIPMLVIVLVPSLGEKFRNGVLLGFKG